MPKFKIGDEVRCNVDGYQGPGTISSGPSVNPTTGAVWYGIEINPHWIVGGVPENQIKLLNETDTKCDCGAQKLNHPGHSHWCSAAQTPAFTSDFTFWTG